MYKSSNETLVYPICSSLPTNELCFRSRICQTTNFSNDAPCSVPKCPKKFRFPSCGAPVAQRDCAVCACDCLLSCLLDRFDANVSKLQGNGGCPLFLSLSRKEARRTLFALIDNVGPSKSFQQTIDSARLGEWRLFRFGLDLHLPRKRTARTHGPSNSPLFLVHGV